MAFTSGGPEITGTGLDNVIDLKKDSLLKLQLEIAQELKALKASGVDTFVHKENFTTNIDNKEELLILKGNISGNKSNGSELAKKYGAYDRNTNNNEDFGVDKIINDANNMMIGDKTIDKYVEGVFDEWIVEQDKFDNEEQAERAFSDKLVKDPQLTAFYDKIFEPLKSAELAEVNDKYKFELHNLKNLINNDSQSSNYNINNQGTNNINLPTADVVEDIKPDNSTNYAYNNETSSGSLLTAFSYINSNDIEYSNKNYGDNNKNNIDLKDSKDKKALRQMTGIGFLNLFRSENDNFELTDKEYNPKKGEKEKLISLKKTINHLGKGDSQFFDAFKFVSQTYNNDKNINWNNINPSSTIDLGNGKTLSIDGLNIDAVKELGKLYSFAKQERNEHPYFSNLIALFDREIIENGNTDLSDILNNSNNLLTDKDLGLITKREKYWIDMDEEMALKRGTDKAIDEILKNPEENKAFKKILKLKEDGLNVKESIKNYNNSKPNKYTGRSRQETKFLEYREKFYEASNTAGLNDGQKTYPDFVNAADALIWTDMDMVDYANQKILEKQISDDNISPLNATIGRLSDLNVDGSVSVEDSKNIRGGLQIAEAYYAAVNELDENKVFENLVDFAIARADKEGNTVYKDKLTSLRSTHTLKTVDPGVLYYLQDTIVNSPLDVSEILRNGKDSFTKKMEVINNIDKQTTEKINNWYNGQIANLPKEQKDFLEKNVGEIIPNIQQAALSLHESAIGGGVNISLDQILKGLTITPSIATSGSSNIGAGLALGWNKDIQLDNNDQLALGISAGATLGFIPFAALGITWINSNEKLNMKDLNATGIENKISLGAHVTTYGSRGLHVGYNVERSQAIENKENNIKTSIKSLISDYLKDTDSNKNITTYLQKKYPKSDELVLKKAANNINKALNNFGLVAETTEKDKKVIAQLVGDLYALQRRNEKIVGLDRWDFAGIGVGIDFLAGFFPIPSLCMQVAKYKNQFYQETAESVKQRSIAERSGFGNRELTGTMDENITKLNGLLEHSINGKNKTGRAEVAEVANIEKSSDGRYLVIPRDLRFKNLATVVIDPSLKGAIQKDENGNILVPKNAPLRLMKTIGQGKTVYVLNIGATNSNKESLILNTNQIISQDWIGSKERISEEDKIIKAQLDTQINTLKNNNSSFPIDKVEIKDGKIYYTTKTGLIISGLTNPVDFDKTVSIEFDASLMSPNGVYSAVESQSTDGKHHFEYKAINQTINVTRNLPNIELANPDIKDIKNICDNINNTDLGKIKDWDEGQKNKFFEFVANSDNSIQYQNALNSIKDLVNGFTGSYRRDLLNLISTNNTNANKKAYLVDYIKMIFADNGEGTVIDKLNRHGGDGFLSIQGPEKSAKFSDEFKTNLKGYKTEFINGTFPEYTKADGFDQDKILGYTGRYRKDAKNEEAKNYSLTALGSTETANQDGKNYIRKLEDTDYKTDLTDAKEWFLKNIKENRPQQDMILDMIKKACSDTITKNDITNGTTIIEKILNGDTIDIGDKKVKLNVDYVFYLLKPCANESIGIQIKDIVVTEPLDDETEKIDIEKPSSSEMFINTQDSRSEAMAGESNNINIGIVGMAKKEIKKTPDTGEGDDGISGEDTGSGSDGIGGDDNGTVDSGKDSGNNDGG